MNTQLSKSVKASWKDPMIAARRTAKHHVKVRGHGEFRSVCAAFQELGLPMNRHMAFRAELKRAGKASFKHDGKAYSFSLVGAEMNK